MANSVILRDETSGISTTFPEKVARRLLAHPVFGKNLKEVRTDKPEVLVSPSANTKPAIEVVEQPEADKEVK